MICIVLFFFFKQKTAYEMRISDWSSDVCSSDLGSEILRQVLHFFELAEDARDVGKDRLRLAGRLQATAGTLEELQAELLLAMLQHRADRRLGHVQHARGRRHRAGLHDGMEDLHLAEVHHRSFIVLASNIRLTYSMASAIDWTPRAPAEILRGKKAILGEPE